jgi:microsomal dipeptidase-like Zn-dependent dipeptidase
LESLLKNKRLIERMSKIWNLQIVTSRLDLARPGLKIVMGLQHSPLSRENSRIGEIAAHGIRICTIGYEDENLYGSGFQEP